VTATVWAYAAYSSDFLDIYFASDAANPSWQLLTTAIPTHAGANVLTVQVTLPSGGPVAAIRGQFRYGGSASNGGTAPDTKRRSCTAQVR
jgi:hypothetical protein